MRKQPVGLLLVSWSLASFTGHERRYLTRRSRPILSVKPVPKPAPAAEAPAQ